MNYIEFLDQISKVVQERMGTQYHIGIRGILKNNGIKKFGLTVQKKNRNTAPNLYLDSFYEKYLKTEQFDEVAEEFLAFLKTTDQKGTGILESVAESISVFRPQSVFPELINRSKNEELLRSVPHHPFLDLEMVFRVVISEDKGGESTVLVNNALLETWGKSLEEITLLSMNNMREKRPAKIRHILEIMSEMIGKKSPVPKHFKEPQEGFYVLTDEKGIKGAVYMADDALLHRIAEQWGMDIIILPSSTHEVLLLPYQEQYSLKQLEEMVQSVNRDNVAPEEVLSNRIYRFYRDRGSLEIWKGNADE